MTQTRNRPRGTHPGAESEQVGQTTSRQSTYPGRGIAIGRHRRHCRAFDRWALDYYGEELCARYGITSAARNPEPYAAGGMTLGVRERERAA